MSSDEAVHDISERLTQAGIIGDPLPAYEIARYRRHEFASGWEFSVQFTDRARRIRLLVPIDAPWEFPRVALVDAPLLQWPHVDRDGLLCLRPDSWTLDPSQSGETAIKELGAAADLIEELVAGGREADFREEFRSYWALICKDRIEPIYSIADPGPPSRQVYVWRGQDFSLIGDTTDALEQWLKARFPSIREKDLAFEQAGFIWLNSPPIPAEFPRSMAKLKALAANAGADLDAMLEGFEARDNGEFVIVLGAQATSGKGFIGVSVRRRHTEYGYRPIGRGYRYGKCPHEVMAARVLNGSTVARKVERADPAWIHGRDHDTRLPTLQNARVAILGCGSVGSFVAELLALAGVGNFVLIDPESLTWANVGRHVLGAEYVGCRKAESLAMHLKKRLPHVRHFDFATDSWQRVARMSPQSLIETDLIVSMTGDWSSESQLNAWSLSKPASPRVLYGWTEAFCCAGHGVCIAPAGGCLRCGFSPLGLASFQVGSWPEGSTLRQEPACGADFAPYGPVELMHICAMIAEFAIESLLTPSADSVHRIWAGSQHLLDSTGGEWTPAWRELVRGGPLGSRREERRWARSAGCPACGGGGNA